MKGGRSRRARAIPTKRCGGFGWPWGSCRRTIFNLKIYESRSNQEIADMLNVSVNTVKVHYARTMKHLCQRLKKN